MQISVAPLQGQALRNTIVQPIWDSVLLGLTNTGTNYLFQVAQGGTKTLVETNMVQAGAIPSPDAFALRGFMIQILPNAPANAAFVITDISDIQRLFRQTIFTFKVGTANRQIVQGALDFFPAGIGLEGTVTTGGATAGNVAFIVGNGVRSLDNRFGLGDTYKEVLQANSNFRGELTWPNAGATVSVSHTLKCILTGLWGQSVG